MVQSGRQCNLPGLPGEEDQEAPDGSFRFRPPLRRYGLFGNYLFFDKPDLVDGFLKSEHDWRRAATGRLYAIYREGIALPATLLVMMSVSLTWNVPLE